jgi:phosphohistidine phosphatase
MLRLLLLRHAKAAPHDAARDRDRPLIARGRGDASRIGRYIASEKFAIEAAIHSGVKRAKETLVGVMAELPKKLPVSVEPCLYEQTAATVIKALRALPDETKTILVVGHNPSMAGVAHYLAGDGQESDLERMATKFPTAGLAIVDFDISHWADMRRGEGRLFAFVTPATLEEAGD